MPTPHFDLSKDTAITVESENLTYKQILLERVILKTFKDKCIPLDVTHKKWCAKLTQLKLLSTFLTHCTCVTFISNTFVIFYTVFCNKLFIAMLFTNNA